MYDAIVVGARCAGSPTAMLLARQGYRVLLLDKSSFPSDIMSTHFIHPPGVDHLRRWGVLDAVRASNCPPIPKVNLHFGDLAFSPPAVNGAAPYEAYCPRRTVLDKILVDAAVAAGAELRESFSVRELATESGCVMGVRGGIGSTPVSERARIVIGADGMRSTVARAVKAPTYREIPSATFAYYTYWSGLDLQEGEIYFGEDSGALAFPTNDGLTCIPVGGPSEGFHAFRSDIEGNYLQALTAFPKLAERVPDGKREERFIGTADMPNFFRKPYGPGWALVGDAGYHKDFVTGLGITDAFRDAELLAQAIDDGFAGRRPLEEALASYEQQRNEIATPLYELTTSLLSGPVELAHLAPQFVGFGLALARC